MSDIYNGDEVIIKGVITKTNGTTKKSFDVRDHINNGVTETASQASQSVVQSIISQAQSAGLSGCIAMGSGVYFQADAVVDNWQEAHSIAQPMVAELIETGTIKDTLPADSKYNYVEIPTTTSFFGMKVGEAKKQQEAYDKLTPEQKALQDEFKKSVSPPTPTRDDTTGSAI